MVKGGSLRLCMYRMYVCNRRPVCMNECMGIHNLVFTFCVSSSWSPKSQLTYVYKNFAMHAPITRVVTMDGNCGLVQCAMYNHRLRNYKLLPSWLTNCMLSWRFISCVSIGCYMNCLLSSQSILVSWFALGEHKCWSWCSALDAFVYGFIREQVAVTFDTNRRILRYCGAYVHHLKLSHFIPLS